MKVMLIGAHPDDPVDLAGGVIRLFTSAGHEVLAVSMTNGSGAHPEMRGPSLVEHRRQEAWAAGALGEYENKILNHHDGRLEDNLAGREELISIIRGWNPDLIVTHRPNDLKPDHRVSSILVHDAIQLLNVPMIVPREGIPKRLPALVYFEDAYAKPLPFEPDVVVGIDEVMDDKIAILDAHGSQFYEWRPFLEGRKDEVPLGVEERRHWLGERCKERARKVADDYRHVLEAIYGKAEGKKIEFAEAFEASEIGLRLTSKNRGELFPFFAK